MKKYLLIILLLTFGTQWIFSQSILTLEDAKKIAIDNSYNTQISKNNILSIENNTRLIKAGNKPTFSLNAGLNGQLSNNNVKVFTAPESQTNWFAPSLSSNIGAAGNYLLWDGHQINNRVKQNEATSKKAQLSLKATNEEIVYQVENIYLNILQLLERQKLLEESIEISYKRKLRAQYAFEYGQSNKLNLLNANVDLNRDSLDLIRFTQQVVNLKRNLNLLLNRDINIDYSLENDLNFEKNKIINQKEFIEKAISSNINILEAKESLNISSYDKAINNSNLKPQVFANASYGLNYQKNSAPNFLDYSFSDGLRLGLSASWLIGDGGRTKILNENADIRIKTQSLIVKQLEDQVKMSISNLLGDYGNALRLYNLELENVATAQENFERSQELFNQAQINSITFRQAQLNLLNTKLSVASAKYEILLLQLDLEKLKGGLLK